jgi:hypothetical protein
VRVVAPADLPAPDRIDIFHMDARNAVDDLLQDEEGGSRGSLDAVYGDAFNHYSVPFHLVTREFTEKVHGLLKASTGIYLLNVVDILGEGRFAGAVCATMRAVFPHVYVIATRPAPDDATRRDTIVIVGANRALDLTGFGQRDGEMPGGVVLSERDTDALESRAGRLVLTDDFAPVENLLASVVRNADVPHAMPAIAQP